MIDYPQGTPEVDIPGVPDDTKYLGDKLDGILLALRELRETTTRREDVNPTILEVLTFDGVAAATPFGRISTSTRIRVTGLIMCLSSTGAIVSLLIGARRYRFRAATVTIYIPFPIVIDAGVDVAAESSALQAAGSLTGFYVIGYPDLGHAGG